jgi:hypothetical protein
MGTSARQSTEQPHAVCPPDCISPAHMETSVDHILPAQHMTARTLAANESEHGTRQWRLPSTVTFVLLAALVIGQPVVYAAPLVVDGATVTLCGENTYDYVEVINGGAIQATASCSPLTINSDSYIMVDATSRIWDGDSIERTDFFINAVDNITVSGLLSTRRADSTAQGGGIFIQASGDVILTGTLRSDATSGGDIEIDAGGLLEIVSGTVYSGSAYAGPMSLSGSNVHISGGNVPSYGDSSARSKSVEISAAQEIQISNDVFMNGAKLGGNPPSMILMAGTRVDLTGSRIFLDGRSGRDYADVTPGGFFGLYLTGPGDVILGSVYTTGGSCTDNANAIAGANGGPIVIDAPSAHVVAHGTVSTRGGDAQQNNPGAILKGGDGREQIWRAASLDQSYGVFNAKGGKAAGSAGSDGGDIAIEYCLTYDDTGATYDVSGSSGGMNGTFAVTPNVCTGVSDCNDNSVDDVDDLTAGTSLDCNNNNIPDECDIFSGTSLDIDSNGNPDECDFDCNSNGVGDGVDILFGTSGDCDIDGVPDECEEDCNANGIPDNCDIYENSTAPGGPFFCTADCALDCNSNGVPDECDLASGTSGDCNSNGIPDACDISSGVDGDCNTNGVPDSCDVYAGTSIDCNNNLIPDDCEVAVESTLVPATLSSIALDASTGLFRQDSSMLTYQDMIVGYGRPWPADTGQTPDITTNGDPASRLRALAALRTCASDPLLFAPVFHELYSFEMLLGNEAYTDALDPTIGLHGISASELGDLYCFQGAPGVGSLLVEELNLLRGRDLCPGGGCDPADWLNDTTYFPTYTGNDSLGNPGSTRAAIYNRMPPNAEGFSALAYQSNYGPDENYEAVLEQYPQGHGDAYGYYLTATTTYLDVLRGEPSTPDDGISLFADALINAQQTDTEQVQPDGSPDVPVAHQSVRNMANAMAAKARAGLRVVDLTFRRDYREDPEDPEHDQILVDTDTDRAWGTGDWARRAGLGAYLDWAITSQLTPAGTNGMLGEVNRSSVEAISELASTASKLQERVDTAGGGLNPLGLVSNVVPFGINAGQLDAWIQNGSGKSHYEQVRDAAVNALANARSVLEYANQASQRMREQDESLFQFSEQVADRAADFQNRLIELHGYPSDRRSRGQRPRPYHERCRGSEQRPGPGELPAGCASNPGSRLVGAPGTGRDPVGDVGVETCRTADRERTERARQLARRDGRPDAVHRVPRRDAGRRDRHHQPGHAGDDRAGGTRQTDAVGVLSAGSLKKAVKSAVKSARGGSYTAMYASALLSAAQQSAQINANFEMQKEQARISGWKEAELTQISQKVEIERERLRLQSLVRQSPQLMVNLKIAEEHALQATGRLHAAVQRGQRLLDERERIRRLQRDQLESYRWEDLAFRVFRNNAIQKYDAFFDVAARFVMLSGRSFAYEYNDRSTYDELEQVARERRLGKRVGTSGGLQGVLNTWIQLRKRTSSTPVHSAQREDLPVAFWIAGS